ncbi:MAG TPA: precorrin-6y C5,15-methyltransferase (decarboxylating) subunit CbiE [Propionibacteriaceae bacterium]|nr:precorrin-6y C5,15-methyltransferase (decarboxylating) subunit CbiE [Propionibacteriaceae bacterium]HBY23351.1 precorrin-6y C5,15-methyltransferase (decarboxylating) subunit CbiE [Propionibacteriaceae bacterium]
MITVFGLLGSPSSELRASAATADWVVGGRRHLDALAVPDARRITLGALRLAIAQIAALPPTSAVTVVASGDPLFFGVVRSLRAAGLQPRVVTAPSSIAAAFAAVGVPWDDAVVVSAHGRPLGRALNLARAYPKVAVFTSAENGVRELAAGLAGLSRRFVLAERLGEDDERILILDASQALTVEPREPNVVLIVTPSTLDDDPPWAAVQAAPDRADRPQVAAAAAVAFVRMLPEPGDLVWVTGPLADELAALADWAGAAVTTASSGEPDLILTDDLRNLSGRSPRCVVLTTPHPDPLPAGYRWSAESIGDHHLTTGVRA